MERQQQDIGTLVGTLLPNCAPRIAFTMPSAMWKWQVRTSRPTEPGGGGGRELEKAMVLSRQRWPQGFMASSEEIKHLNSSIHQPSPSH